MTQLPIHAVIADIQQALEHGDELILQAPPGAGKTTAVPLALLNQNWLKAKILVLEPRRMAARAAAERMAYLLEESVGESVGYRIREETKVSPRTKIEVVTGGVLTRLLQQDPSLENYSLIIFDEFHERNLDSDVGLALALHGRSIFRDKDHPLKLLVMSATLNSDGISEVLANAPVIRSEGRNFPVTVTYCGSSTVATLVDRVYKTVLTALNEQEGSILVFLPGQKEISAVLNQLTQQVGSHIKITPLYGNLSLGEQQQAIAPITSSDKSGYTRKIVLATDIAETSLTIEGVTVIVDSGFRREPMFDPRTGMTRLHTTRISQASAIQRMGRAGRTAPGSCYRVWSRDDCLSAFSKAEIEQADLSPLVLQLLAFGICLESDVLSWVTPPPKSAFNQALDLLESLGAIEKRDEGVRLLPHGQYIAEFPAHPRLAHMMILGANYSLPKLSARLAAALSEPSKPKELTEDIEQWFAIMDRQLRNHNSWMTRVEKLSERFLASLKISKQGALAAPSNPIGFLIALAYPDRIAKKRPGDDSLFQLSNGRSASFDKGTQLLKSDWLCVAELGGNSHSSSDRIYTAASIDPILFENELKDLVTESDVMEWSERQHRFIAEKRWYIGSIVWKSQKCTDIPLTQKQKFLSQLIKQKGLDILTWTNDCQQWCARIELIRSFEPSLQKDLPQWPNVSNEGLLNSLEGWFEPFVANVTTLQDLKKLDIMTQLQSLLPWSLQKKLEDWAPTHLRVPSGSSILIDYSQSPPVLAVKLQEMFGCKTTPKIVNERVSLVLHLLSPARRPLQVTQDLAGFWGSSYIDVKKEMKGRYPKHPWPDDPTSAIPTRHTKKRSSP